MIQDLRLYPALHLLAIPCHLNQAGTTQLLQVMGKSGGGYVDTLAELADAETSSLVDPARGAGRATSGKALEQGQSVRIAEGLELPSVVLNASSTLRHVSNYNRPRE